ncbi:hypothetical protein CHARACLAT_033665, partial [Characodon lateralis]|nr:hypothetical protein [Characodon lateralis]
LRRTRRIWQDFRTLWTSCSLKLRPTRDRLRRRRSRPTPTCPGSGRFSMRWRKLRSVLTSLSLRSTSSEPRAVMLESLKVN